MARHNRSKGSKATATNATNNTNDNSTTDTRRFVPSTTYVLPIPQAPDCAVCGGFGCVACPKAPPAHCGQCCGLGCGACNVPFARKRMGHGAPTAQPRQQRASNASSTAAQAQHVVPVDGVDASTAKYVHGSYAIVARTIAAQGGSTTLAALVSALRANPEWQANHAGACIGSTVCAMRSTRRFGSVLVESIKLGKGAANETLTLTDAGQRWLAAQAS